jgi:hypothetical protein
MNKTFCALALAAVVVTASCKKVLVIKDETDKETEQPGQQTVTKEAIVGVYKITKVETSSAGLRADFTGSWFQHYAGECSKNDITEFKPDHSFVVLDGNPACSNSTDDAGTWSLISDTKMKIDADTAHIEAVTTTTLRIVSPVYSTAQSQIIFTYTRH